MKKIFAIALALVMVCSMASAFALTNCTTGNFSWSCPTTDKCGKGKVEVIPYVRTNNGWGGSDWQVSTCAAAIHGEKIYYAVKLTVEANRNELWWDKTNGVIEMSYAGVDESDPTVTHGTLKFNAKVDDKSKDVEWFYNFNTNLWDKVDDNFEFGNGNVHGLTVTDARKAKVCATLASEHDGINTWEYKGYTVNVTFEKITFTKGGKTVTIKMDADGKVMDVNATDAEFFAQVVADFNLNGCAIGTCMTKNGHQEELRLGRRAASPASS